MSLKNITISFIIFFLGAGSVFAEIKQKGNNYDNTGYGGNDQGAGTAQYQDYLNNEAKRLNINDSTTIDGKYGRDTQALEKAVLSSQNAEYKRISNQTDGDAGNPAVGVPRESKEQKIDGTNKPPVNNSAKTPVQFNCTKGTLCSDSFMIPTSKFSPGGTSFVAKGGAKKTMNSFFTTLIQKLMIALGSLALLIMVVGAGFMMFAMGKDDNLNKGKTIFKAGIIALVIALSSYFMVSFLSFILYS